MENMVTEVDPSGAWSGLQEIGDAILVDVRTQAEWSFVGIPDLSEMGKQAVLVEWASLPGMQKNPDFLDGVMSQSLGQLEQLWQLRERISESIAPHTPYKNDISVTVSKVPDFVEDVDKVVQDAYPDFEIVWFGHIGDGNMHLNILKPADLLKEDFFRQCGDVSKWVFEIVQKYEGSISAEHGVGMTKKPYLSYSRSEEEIAYMKAVKAVFDPNNVMNPGKLFDV